MSLENLNRLETIFLKAADMAHTEQAKFLDQACAGDPQLRAQVEAMLRSDEKGSESILLAVEQEAASLFQVPPLEGTRLGAYRVQRLGRDNAHGERVVDEAAQVG